MSKKNYSLSWDIDSFFKGGSHSAELQAKLEQTSKELAAFTTAVSEWDGQDYTVFTELTSSYANLGMATFQMGSFVECFSAADASDTYSDTLLNRLGSLNATLQNASNELSKKTTLLSDEHWQLWLETDALKEIAFVLDELRTNQTFLLSDKEETLINNLSVDGYAGWSAHYDTLVHSMRFDVVNEQGEAVSLSAGQTDNLLNSANYDVRHNAFKVWEQTWQEKGALFADTLNHLIGFRLAKYQAREWDILDESLRLNRLEEATLNSIWDVVSNNKAPVLAFLERKAKMLNLDKLGWVDVEAPLTLTDTQTTLTFQEGAEFIEEHFAKFSPKMAEFARNAFENNWIEAEDRDNKRPGGFCTEFPEDGESRIFMTYDGSANTISTLAHELGHAFHSHVMRDQSPLNRDYAMNVAETASTFAEILISDAAIKVAASKEEHIQLLEDKIQRSVAFFMNIHSRFLFEKRFHKARLDGAVTVEGLNKLMEDAQKEAYVDSLKDYHPTFWQSKLHFYIDDIPFYNYPYTFGFLFSAGIYAHAGTVEGSYEDAYIALLQDTGSMTTEELAQKHLNVDLTKPDFWQAAVDIILKDIDEFLELTK